MRHGKIYLELNLTQNDDETEIAVLSVDSGRIIAAWGEHDADSPEINLFDIVRDGIKSDEVEWED